MGHFFKPDIRYSSEVLILLGSIQLKNFINNNLYKKLIKQVK
jgi:hypothetical protein